MRHLNWEPQIEIQKIYILLGQDVGSGFGACCAPTQQPLKTIISSNKIVFCFDEMFEFHIAKLGSNSYWNGDIPEATETWNSMFLKKTFADYGLVDKITILKLLFWVDKC